MNRNIWIASLCVVLMGAVPCRGFFDGADEAQDLKRLMDPKVGLDSPAEALKFALKHSGPTEADRAAARRLHEKEVAKAKLVEARDPARLERVERTLQALLRQANRTGWNIEAFLFAADNSGPYSLGLTIYLPTGFVDAVTDDELMFCIGHELGHIIALHSIRRMALSNVLLRRNLTAEETFEIVQAHGRVLEREADILGHAFARAAGAPEEAGEQACQVLYRMAARTPLGDIETLAALQQLRGEILELLASMSTLMMTAPSHPLITSNPLLESCLNYKRGQLEILESRWRELTGQKDTHPETNTRGAMTRAFNEVVRGERPLRASEPVLAYLVELLRDYPNAR